MHAMDGMHAYVVHMVRVFILSLIWYVVMNLIHLVVLLCCFSCTIHPFEHTMGYFLFSCCCCCLSQSSYIYIYQRILCAAFQRYDYSLYVPLLILLDILLLCHVFFVRTWKRSMCDRYLENNRKKNN